MSDNAQNAEHVREPVTATGYAVASVDGLGEGWGIRKVRRALEVAEFGVNVIVMPPKYDAGPHLHETQEELYFVHEGEIEVLFHESEARRLGPGGMARVDAATVRRMRNVSDADAVILIVGAKGGYIGRDGALPDGEFAPAGPITE